METVDSARRDVAMKKPKYSSIFLTLVAAIFSFAGGMNGGRAQETPAKPAADQPKTAEQQFKNIQVLSRSGDTVLHRTFLVR